MAPLPVPDIVLLAFFAVFFLRGLFRGTLRELSNLLAWALGLFAAARFSGVAETELKPYLGAGSPWLGPVTVFLTFLAVWVGVNLGGRFLSFIVRSGSLGPADRLGGGLLGAVKAVFLAAAALALVEVYAPERLPGRDAGTRILPYVQDLAARLRRTAPSSGEPLKAPGPAPVSETQPLKR